MTSERARKALRKSDRKVQSVKHTQRHDVLAFQPAEEHFQRGEPAPDRGFLEVTVFKKNTGVAANLISANLRHARGRANVGGEVGEVLPVGPLGVRSEPLGYPAVAQEAFGYLGDVRNNGDDRGHYLGL
jgi:hypothetical protein